MSGYQMLLAGEAFRAKYRTSFERPTPLQIGGDAEGLRDEVTFGMAANPVELVDFGPRAVA